MFKKCLLVVMCCLLCACENKSEVDYTKYYEYIEVINNNSEYVKPTYYDLSVELTKVDDGYRYYVILDNPQVAMYDIVMMVVDNTNEDKLMPNTGLFGDSYNLVPNQVNRDEGFVKGITLSGDCANDMVSLKIMVEWHDKSKANTYREFLEYENVEVS